LSVAGNFTLMTPRANGASKNGAKAAAQNKPKRKSVYLDIMDTTLRDGEQTQGVSMPAEEKLLMAQRLLAKVKVDRIEVASCRVSDGEQRSLAMMMEWAKTKGWTNRIEVLSFTDHKASVDWMMAAGCHRMNLLTKGSLNHCKNQLRKEPSEHRADVKKTLDYATSKGCTTNIYLEDWSNGMIHSRNYVFEMLDHYCSWNFESILLPDTLGILNPTQVKEFLTEIVERYPEQRFEFHGHNDYGFGTANALVAAECGVAGLHCTVNGLGERAGNSSLEEIVPAIRDHSNRKVRINEQELKNISELVEIFSGKRIADNKPIVGRNVFTQTAGIYADGDAKGNLYESALSPQRFGRDRVYALGKLSGRSNLDFNLKALNLDLSKEQRSQILKRIVELGDKKHNVTQEDLPFIVADVLKGTEEHAFRVVNCVVTSARGVAPSASILISFKGEEFEAVGQGTGGFDAFMTALRSLSDKIDVEIPHLLDYEVHIPPGGKTDALVETTISWDNGLRTKAVHTDQVMAAIEATERALNLGLQGVVAKKRPNLTDAVSKTKQKPKTRARKKAKKK